MKQIIFSKSFALAFAMTFVCSVLSSFLAGMPYLSVIGALVISLLLGMACQVWSSGIDTAQKGIGFISNKFLRLGIILLGFKLNLVALADAGIRTIALACIIVAAVIFLTYNLARKLGVGRHLAILTASGTGICGAAAVMGISSQLSAKDNDEEVTHRDDRVVAVAIVAILGTLFTLIEIFVGPLLGMTETQYGVMAGGTLHEIAHAVAAGSALGTVSLDIAIITKLSRVLLLAPAAIIIGIWYRKKEGIVSEKRGLRSVPIPWFMVGFVLASVVGTFAPLSPELLDGLVRLSYLVLGMAMAALGMSVNFRVLLLRGRNAFIASAIISVVLLASVAAAALLLF